MWRRQLAVREVQRAREVAATVRFGVVIQACARRWLAKRKVKRWLVLREQQEQARIARIKARQEAKLAREVHLKTLEL